MENTGYLIKTYKDANPYSSTFNQTKTERIYDTTTCPLPLTSDIKYIVEIPTDNFYDSYSIHKNYGDEIIVDWGDGVIESIGGTITEIHHTYTLAGSYQVNITVEVFGAGFEANSIGISARATEIISYSLPSKVDAFSRLFASPNYIITELNPVFNITGGVDTYYSFLENSTTLTRVNDGTFDNQFTNTNTIYRLFYNCPNLTYIPENTLASFGGDNISNILNNNPKLELNINNFFSYVDLSKITNISFAFSNCAKITGEALPIINQLSHLTVSTTYLSAFSGCTSLSDFDQIPSGWK